MAAVFAASMGTGVFTFTLPLMNLDEKAGGMWLGSGFAGYFLAKLLIAPLSGNYADRHGILKPLALSCIFAAILPLPYIIFPSIQTLYAIQFMLGLCAGTIRTVSMAAIGSSMQGNDLAPRFAHLSAAMNSSFLLGPLLGGLLYIDKSYMPILGTMAVFMVGALLLFLFSAGNQSCRLPADTAAPPEKVSETRLYFSIMLALFGRGMGIGALIAFYPVLLKSTLQISPGMTAALFSVPSLFTVLLLPLSGRLLAGFNKHITTFAGMAVSALALYIIAGCSTISGFIFSGILSGTGAAISMPPSMAICAKLGHRKGRILGLANMATNIGFMAGPLLYGFIVTLSGNISTPFRLTAIVGAIGILPILYEGLRELRTVKTAVTTITLAAFVLVILIPLHMSSHDSGGSPDVIRYSDVAMGTVVNLTIVSTKNGHTEDKAREAVSLMHRIQKDLDHRNKRGSIGRLNHNAGIRSVKVSEKALKTIESGLDFSAKSKGSFDITIGAITTTPFYYALDKSRFDGHRRLIDYRLVQTDKTSSMASLPKKGMAIDLGGLAKGTIIDAAADYLKDAGIKTAMVEAGGDFMVFGERVWSIGIRNPRGSGIIGYIRVKDSAVCGSGDYYQFISAVSEDDHRRKHHIFDPALLESSSACIATTTVAPNAETADALATAIFIMGPEKGMQFMEKHYPESSAMWILPDMSIKTTSNFPEITEVKTDKNTP